MVVKLVDSLCRLSLGLQTFRKYEGNQYRPAGVCWSRLLARDSLKWFNQQSCRARYNLRVYSLPKHERCIRQPCTRRRLRQQCTRGRLQISEFADDDVSRIYFHLVFCGTVFYQHGCQGTPVLLCYLGWYRSRQRSVDVLHPCSSIEVHALVSSLDWRSSLFVLKWHRVTN